MGKFAIDNDNRFTIESPELKTVEIEDPDNWDSDDKVYSYDKLGGGTLTKNNTSLELIGKGYETVYSYPLVYGYGSDLTLTKWIKNPVKIGEDWRIAYQTGIDLLNAEFDRSRSISVARVQFTQGGLYDRIAARYKDKYDLVSTKDADGNDIGELKTITETVSGREIFRISKGTVEDGTRKRHIVTGGDKDNATAVPFLFRPNSDSGNIEDAPLSTAHIPYNNGDYADGSVASLIFKSQDRYHERKLNGRVKIKIIDGDRGRIRIQKVFYKYNSDTTTYEFTGKNENLADIDADSFGSFLEYNFVDHPVNLEKNEAMAIVIFSSTNDGIEYQYYDTYLNITEDDTFVTTSAKCLLPYEMIDRLLQKITGESGLLVSNVLGRTDLGYKEDGDWSLLGVSSGFWARGFDIGQPIINSETGEPEPPKQFTISLKDAFESLNVPDPMFWGIEKIKGKEYFRLEKYGYIQQDFIGIRMGRGTGTDFQHIPASKPVETVLGDNIYTGVKIGYEKGGSEYEEVSGLSAPHGNAEYNTYLKTSPNVYMKLSSIRADPEGYDLARRKQAIYYPDTDTTYDQDLFFRDLKKSGTQYVSRTWQDDFETAPKNIYSPGTATNLRLAPFICLLRHGRIISTGISKKPNEKLVWISSNCNSDLITKEAGKSELAENGFVLNKDLGVPFIDGRLLKFDGKVYQSMIDQIEGFTELDGESIPNWFGLFEVMVQGRLMYGRLSSSNIKGEGKHEIALI